MMIMYYDILSEIKHLLKLQYAQRKEILNFEEAVEYLTVSKSFLYKVTSSGKLTHYKPGGKLIFFKRIDLDEWLLQNKCEGLGVFEKEVEKLFRKK